MDNVAELLWALRDDTDAGLITTGDDGDTEHLSWADHVEASLLRAGVLRDLLPPDHPPHIGVLLDNSTEFSLLFGACAFGGAVLVGLNNTRRGAALVADVERADCQAVLVDASNASLLTSLSLEVPVIRIDDDGWADRIDETRKAGAGLTEPAECSGDDLLMLIFTSGTTGDPKAVQCSHLKFAAAGHMLASRFGLDRSDVCHLSMPMFHSNAMIAGWSVAVAAGASLVIRPKFSARGFVTDVATHRVSYANYVGKPLRYILATAPGPNDTASSLKIMYGNEAAAADREAFARRFGCHVVDGFGSTEGGVAITRTPDTPDDALGPLADPVAIVDPQTGKPVPAGEVGEIVNTSGAGFFTGYYGDAAATDDRMRGGVYHSGDLGWVDENGFIRFAGRLGDWMRVDGENLAALPIERILHRHPAITEAAVFGVPVDIGDEVHAVLVADSSVLIDLADFLDGQGDLGPKQWPQVVQVVDEMPETATFKTLKRALATAPGVGPTWRLTDGAYVPTP